LQQYQAGKVVIYSNSVNKVERVAKQLVYKAYFYKAVGKASILADFIARKQRVIIATSALGIGIDIPDI
jgi:superfamily II DNA helicase RecQ